MLPVFFPEPLEDLFALRSSVVLGEMVSQREGRAAVEALKQHTAFLASWAVRPLANAWCTSRRMGEDRLPCLFGCGPRLDDLAHYIDCPVLWSWVHDVTQLPVPARRKQRLLLEPCDMPVARLWAVVTLS